jgi:hypothetical protein
MINDEYLASSLTAIFLPADLRALARGQWQQVIDRRGYTTAILPAAGSVSLQDVTIECSDTWAAINPAKVRSRKPTRCSPPSSPLPLLKRCRRCAQAGRTTPARPGSCTAASRSCSNGTADGADPPANVAAATRTMPHARCRCPCVLWPRVSCSTRRIWQPGRRAIHGGQVCVSVGRPLPASHLTGHDIARLCDQARDAICSAHPGPRSGDVSQGGVMNGDPPGAPAHLGAGCEYLFMRKASVAGHTAGIRWPCEQGWGPGPGSGCPATGRDRRAIAKGDQSIATR